MIMEKPLVSHRFRKSASARVIGLISDTHIPTRAKSIPKEVFQTFENTELILHAGDLVNMSVIDELEQVAPVLAVYGNMDGRAIREKLPKINSFTLLDWKIGIMHDPSALFGIRKMREIAARNRFDVLVYGHTHSSKVKWEAGVLFINPGSPTNPVPPFIVKPSVAVLRVTKETITPEIVTI